MTDSKGTENSHLEDVTLPSFMGGFETNDAAPVIGYSTYKGFQARFCLDIDGQQQVHSYERDATGIIHQPSVRVTRLSQGIHGAQ